MRQVMHGWRFSIRSWRRWLLGALLLSGLGSTVAATATDPSAPPPSVALFYGAQVPWTELSAFDWVVLESGHHGDISGRAKAAPRTRFLAYASVGEVNRHDPVHDRVPAAWRIGIDKVWNSAVIDQRPADWPAWFVENVARPQWALGYRGFFLDTLDSYQLVATTPEARAEQLAGVVRVIKALKAAFPEARIIMNRGFEALPEVARDVDMVAAESLYRSWDQASLRYRTVSDKDREWLQRRLEQVRREHNLPVLAIDYVPPQERELARGTARQIRQQGFVPWVTSAQLDTLGVGAVEVLPRRVIVLHDSELAAGSSDLTYSDALRFLGMPLYYLGLVPEYVNPDVQPLPPVQPGQVAGIVTRFSNDRSRPALAAYLHQAITAGVRVVSLGDPGVGDAQVLRRTFGLQRGPEGLLPKAPVTYTRKDALIGFEATPVPGTLDFAPMGAPAGSEVLLQAREGGGSLMDAVAVTPWGGYALNGYGLMRLPTGEEDYRWVVDPIAFLRRALALPDMPVPDPTTETGRRLLMVHIDGDGFPSRSDQPRSPLASEVLLREVLERYRVPTSMSIIEGETSPEGLYPRLAAQSEAIARRMFALPHVEIASHTYSHPFLWNKAERGSFGKDYTLDLPGYRFDAEREIQGSIEYIRRRLAPAGKPVVLLHWSGDTNPGEATLAMLDKSGVLAINGGDTLITRALPSLTHVAPLGVRKGPYFQVYAPNQNENVYTNLFTGPLYGYERVIETFEMTERPYRLKPVDIYFHTYSASRRASLEALHRVYRWALAQPLHPVFPSDYVRKAMNYGDIVVARSDDGFLVRGTGALRELRAPVSLGVPQVGASQGLAGYNVAGREQYLHLSGDEARLPFAAVSGPGASSVVSIVEANARVLSMERTPGRTQFQLQAHVPLRLAVRHPEGCTVSFAGRRLNPTRVSEGIHHYVSDKDGTETLTVGCP